MVGTALAVEAGETVPQGAAEQETVQVTPLLERSSVTVAVNAIVEPAWIVLGFGATVTVIPGIVMVAELEVVGLATEVAVTVTVRFPPGCVAGAE